MTAKLVVSGARGGYDPAKILEELDEYLFIMPGLIVIEGCAPGVDSQVHDWARLRGATEAFGRHWDWEKDHPDTLYLVHFPALWTTHGGCRCAPDKPRCNFAGHRRNLEMLAVDPDEVVGFHPNIRASKGTKHCLRAASGQGIKVTLVGSQLADIPGWPLDKIVQ